MAEFGREPRPVQVTVASPDADDLPTTTEEGATPATPRTDGQKGATPSPTPVTVAKHDIPLDKVGHQDSAETGTNIGYDIPKVGITSPTPRSVPNDSPISPQPPASVRRMGSAKRSVGPSVVGQRPGSGGGPRPTEGKPPLPPVAICRPPVKITGGVSIPEKGIMSKSQQKKEFAGVLVGLAKQQRAKKKMLKQARKQAETGASPLKTSISKYEGSIKDSGEHGSCVGTPQPDGILKKASRKLSGLTGHTSVAASPPTTARDIANAHAISTEGGGAKPNLPNQMEPIDESTVTPLVEIQKGVGPEKDVDQSEGDEDPGCCGDEGYCERFVRACGLKHFAMMIVASLYAALGGAIFHAIEGPPEISLFEAKLNNSFSDLDGLMGNITNILTNSTSYSGGLSAACYSDIKKGWEGGKFPAESRIESLLREYQIYAEIIPENKTNWDFFGSMFYACTLFTTIGYGHYAPATNLGRVATMIYSVIGIPMVLVLLNDLGLFLTIVMRTPWNKFRRFMIRRKKHLEDRKRRIALATIPLATFMSPTRQPLTANVDMDILDSVKKVQKPALIDGDPEAGVEDVEEEDVDKIEFDLPISVAFLMLLSWIFASAGIFWIWEENWSYFKSVYFFFISLTTIGLGDVVPDHPKRMILAFPLVLMGLSFISLVINLLQCRIDELKEQAEELLEEQLGWETETESSSDEEDGIDRGDSDLEDQGAVNFPGEDKVKEGAADDAESPTKRKTTGNMFPGRLGMFGGASSTSIAGSAHGGGDTPGERAFRKPNRLTSKISSHHEPSIGILGGGAAAGPGAKRPPRKRRGMQTEESFVRLMKRDFRRMYPGHRLRDVPNYTYGRAGKVTNHMNTLISELGLILPTAMPHKWVVTTEQSTSNALPGETMDELKHEAAAATATAEAAKST